MEKEVDRVLKAVKDRFRPFKATYYCHWHWLGSIVYGAYAAFHYRATDEMCNWEIGLASPQPSSKELQLGDIIEDYSKGSATLFKITSSLPARNCRGMGGIRACLPVKAEWGQKPIADRSIHLAQ